MVSNSPKDRAVPLPNGRFMAHTHGARTGARIHVAVEVIRPKLSGCGGWGNLWWSIHCKPLESPRKASLSDRDGRIVQIRMSSNCGNCQPFCVQDEHFGNLTRFQSLLTSESHKCAPRTVLSVVRQNCLSVESFHVRFRKVLRDWTLLLAEVELQHDCCGKTFLHDGAGVCAHCFFLFLSKRAGTSSSIPVSMGI